VKKKTISKTSYAEGELELYFCMNLKSFDSFGISLDRVISFGPMQMTVFGPPAMSTLAH